MVVWRGWLAVLTPATHSDLSFVSSHPGCLNPHPPVLSPPPTKDLLDEEEEVGGDLFYDFFAIFLSPHPFGFQAHLFLLRLRESGATIYIVAWELRPRGPFCCEVGWGSGG